MLCLLLMRQFAAFVLGQEYVNEEGLVIAMMVRHEKMMPWCLMQGL